MAMAGPTEFSLEAIRQYLLGREGQATNHDLVKHFKAWLTHPTQKDQARQRFKEYVNTLATIRVQDGVKYLVLKKKFYPRFDDDDNVHDLDADEDDDRQPPVPPTDSGPSLLDEVMASYTPLAAQSFRQPPRRPPPTQPGTPPTAAAPPPPRRQLPPTPTTHYAPLHPDPATVRRPGGGYSFVPPGSVPRQPVARPPPYRPPPPSHPPYRPPPLPVFRGPLPPAPSDLGLPLPSDYGLPTPKQGVFHPPTASPSVHMGQVTRPYFDPAPPLPSRRDSVTSLSRSSSSASVRAPVQLPAPSHGHMPYQQLPYQSADVNAFSGPPPLPSRTSRVFGSQSSIATAASSNSHGNVSRKTSHEEEDKENAVLPPTHLAESGSQPSGGSGSDVDVGPVGEEVVDHAAASQQQKNEKISVKERTKTFNRMASEVGLANIVKPNTNQSAAAAAVKRRNSRAQERRGSSTVRDDESQDSSSISTLDQTAKQWMIRAAQGDYHTLVKMVREDPRLAKHKDFVSGYTALHWAAKHGNSDMVKMLAGGYGVNVNLKSHGGYTPLHVACQFGHQDVFDLLVKAYGADPHLRDNAGKKPRQYMVVQDHAMGLSLSNDTFRQLKDRRRHRRQHAASKSQSGGGILRFGSLSVKVRKTTEAFNNYFNSKHDMDTMGAYGGPNSLPPIMDHQNENAGTNNDAARMPPPKFAPSIKKRRSKRSFDNSRSAPVTPTEQRYSIKEESPASMRKFSTASSTSSVHHASDSDSEYGFDSQWSGGGNS